MDIEEFRELCTLTVEMTRLRQNECRHLYIENFAPELLGKLIRVRLENGLAAPSEREAVATYTMASYRYPHNLLPEYHTALYQLLVGVEQRQSQENMNAYAKNLRRLADSAFITFTSNADASGALRLLADA